MSMCNYGLPFGRFSAYMGQQIDTNIAIEPDVSLASEISSYLASYRASSSVPLRLLFLPLPFTSVRHTRIFVVAKNVYLSIR